MYSFPVRVGELTFTNTVPFRLSGKWFPLPCPSPRLLAQWAEEDRIDAGVLPVVESWRLADFEPLGSYGIAVKRRAGSVLLFSKDPWEKLDGAPIGVTDQTATSVRLLEVLLRNRDGREPLLRNGFHSTDRARLLIGDSALTPPPDVLAQFPHVYDLGEEWYRWQERPFVFARWMVRKNVPAYWRERLIDSLETALVQFSENRENICRQSARFLKRPTTFLSSYLAGFSYRFTTAEDQAEEIFKNRVMDQDRVR